MTRLKNSSRQPSTASGPPRHTSGVRNGRGRFGSLLRSTITAIATMAKANSVPELEMSASSPTGKKAANTATNTPVMMVMTCGVWNCGCTVDRRLRQQAVART